MLSARLSQDIERRPALTGTPTLRICEVRLVRLTHATHSPPRSHCGQHAGDPAALACLKRSLWVSGMAQAFERLVF